MPKKVRESDSKVEYLRRIYTDPSHPASFSGPGRLKREVEREGKYDLSKSEIRSFLESQDTYSLNRLVQRRHKRNRIVVSGVKQQYDMDLCDMSKLSRYRGNKGTKFLLTVIDVFSRRAFVKPLGNKGATTVAKALGEILTDDNLPVRVRSDRGTEFTSSKVNDLLRERGVKHFYSMSDLKCQPVERLNQTLKNAIYRWCYEHRSYSYVPVLDELVYGYNHRVHSALFGLSPSQVDESNQVKLWNLMYTKKEGKNRTSGVPRSFKYNIGDSVRISLAKRTFERSYSQKFTDEVFLIRGRVLRDNIPIYFLMDIEQEPIRGTFYETDIQRVQKNLQDPRDWEIDKILRRRKVGKRQEVLVRFRGLGPKFDRWIPRSATGAKGVH
ncbi:uncharacterized protein LOC123560105 [Mercenaria mercenaria]|uniref:uncharacterized protein LOC123560105 n=1 Tax=Mercenaria mercenaria TaxID=6596 RepID=UPI00234F2C63|nr:uncharacterized protein LOC123560105 [Mercenaria mercenaria]